MCHYLNQTLGRVISLNLELSENPIIFYQHLWISFYHQMHQIMCFLRFWLPRIFWSVHNKYYMFQFILSCHNVFWHHGYAVCKARMQTSKWDKIISKHWQYCNYYKPLRLNLVTGSVLTSSQVWHPHTDAFGSSFSNCSCNSNLRSSFSTLACTTHKF